MKNSFSSMNVWERCEISKTEKKLQQILCLLISHNFSLLIVRMRKILQGLGNEGIFPSFLKL